LMEAQFRISSEKAENGEWIHLRETLGNFGWPPNREFHKRQNNWGMDFRMTMQLWEDDHQGSSRGIWIWGACERHGGHFRSCCGRNMRSGGEFSLRPGPRAPRVFGPEGSLSGLTRKPQFYPPLNPRTWWVVLKHISIYAPPIPLFSRNTHLIIQQGRYQPI
jgi:hypothetical protein